MLNLVKDELALKQIYDWLDFRFREYEEDIFFEKGQNQNNVEIECLSYRSNCLQHNRDGIIFCGWPEIKLIHCFISEFYMIRRSIAYHIARRTGYDTIITSYPMRPKTDNKSSYKNMESITFERIGENGIYWNLTTYFDDWSFEMEINLLLSFDSFDERLNLGKSRIV